MAIEREANATSHTGAAFHSSSHDISIGWMSSSTPSTRALRIMSSIIAGEKSAAYTSWPARASGTASVPEPHPMSNTVSPPSSCARSMNARAYGEVPQVLAKLGARLSQYAESSARRRAFCASIHAWRQSTSMGMLTPRLRPC